MRPISEIINHCTATREGMFVNVAMVDDWHKKRGFKREYRGKTYHIGYHFLIGLEGEIWEGRPVEITGAHVKGHNDGTIGISYVGGLDSGGNPKDTRTSAQKRSLTLLHKQLLGQFPSINKISGHRDYAAKACPCFEAAEYNYLLERKPVEPEFSNPMDDDEPDQPQSWLDETIAALEKANMLQKQGRDALDQAAAEHWKVLQSLREERK